MKTQILLLAFLWCSKHSFGHYEPKIYSVFNFKCFHRQNCIRHESGPIRNITQTACMVKCKSDPNCLSSLYGGDDVIGSCWLDYSLATVCRSNEPEWREEEWFTYCLATCSDISITNGVVDYAPANIVAMPAAGVVATLRCSAGIKSSGSGAAKCQTTGLWSNGLSCLPDNDDDTGLKFG